MVGARLGGAHLEGANLQSARLGGASFSDAYVAGAILTYAHLHQVYFCGARGLTQDQLNTAFDISGIVLPNGLRGTSGK
jgi:uncharacterized protein YjbI with pentapeptide repeats